MQKTKKVLEQWREFLKLGITLGSVAISFKETKSST